MAGFYKPQRSSLWNYGGAKWRLSRSKIDLFVECPRCFYVDNKLGTARPKGFPFNLNSAVDALFKKEFDVHRSAQAPHPLMTKYAVDAVPFQHEEIDTWRENFEGVEVVHQATGLKVCGAVDDIWVTPSGELIVVDYKSTSKEERIETLDKEWQNGYKRQMEVYQWLLRQRGFTVSNTGYFVYANAQTDNAVFDNHLDFEVTLIPYTGDDSWVENTIVNIKKCLDDPRTPLPSASCDYCTYREAMGKALLKNKQHTAPPKPAPPKKSDTLF